MAKITNFTNTLIQNISKSRFFSAIMANQTIFWIAIIFIFDSTYTITITFDSAHYLSLSEIISGEVSWESWDPIRGIVFPLILQVDFWFLGKSPFSLLVLFITLHCVLFFALSSLFVNNLNISGDKEKLLIKSLVFVFVIIDPIVFGYYHVILTEAVAATLLTTSILMSSKLYKLFSDPISEKRNIFVYILYFYFSLPFGWFLKQPYILLPLIPYLLLLLIVFQTKNFKDAKFLGVHFLLMIGLLIVLVLIWNNFSSSARNNYPDRTSEAQVNKILNDQVKSIRESPLTFLRR